MNTSQSILANAESQEPTTAQDLQEATRPHVSELKNGKSWEILQEIFNVRDLMERLNAGEIGKVVSPSQLAPC